jgi:hypothetical protein
LVKTNENVEDEDDLDPEENTPIIMFPDMQDEKNFFLAPIKIKVPDTLKVKKFKNQSDEKKAKEQFAAANPDKMTQEEKKDVMNIQLPDNEMYSYEKKQKFTTGFKGNEKILAMGAADDGFSYAVCSEKTFMIFRMEFKDMFENPYWDETMKNWSWPKIEMDIMKNGQ